MLQNVTFQMPSPLQAGQSVLELACGHLWTWNYFDAPPAQIDCTHCDRGAPAIVGPKAAAARAKGFTWTWPSIEDDKPPS